MLVLRIAFGTTAALRAVFVYGEASRMQEPGWALERAERLVARLQRHVDAAHEAPVAGTEAAWHPVNP